MLENNQVVASIVLCKRSSIVYTKQLTLPVVVTLIALTNFEAVMWYLLDFPTVLLIDLSEKFLPHSSFSVLVGGHPFYVPMNLVASLLWGGIFTLVPLARNMVFRLRRAAV